MFAIQRISDKKYVKRTLPVPSDLFKASKLRERGFVDSLIMARLYKNKEKATRYLREVAETIFEQENHKQYTDYIYGKIKREAWYKLKAVGVSKILVDLKIIEIDLF